MLELLHLPHRNRPRLHGADLRTLRDAVRTQRNSNNTDNFPGANAENVTGLARLKKLLSFKSKTNIEYDKHVENKQERPM